jgi:periplasmic divalent cation tolerance protein
MGPAPGSSGRAGADIIRRMTPTPEPGAAIVVLCTCPTGQTGAEIAKALVAERLAACVNRLPGAHSTFLWEGRIAEDSEELLVIKTARARFDALAARLTELHPYELPEIIAVPIAAGSADYLDWILSCTSPA